MAFGVTRKKHEGGGLSGHAARARASQPAYYGNNTAERAALLEALESANLGWFWLCDAAGHLTYLSPNALESLGEYGADVVGKPMTHIMSTVQSIEGEDSSRPLNFLLGSRAPIRDLTTRLGEEGAERLWRISGKPQFDTETEFTGYVGSILDVTKSHKEFQAASRLAEYDNLTGLANRHRMERRLDQTLKKLKAAKRSFALVMLDLDRFKQVNDSLGHPAGDELLKQVSDRLRKIIGAKGEIARVGGDEFQIIMPDAEDRGDLGDLADEIIEMISQPYSIDGSRATIGTSIGMAIAPYDGVEADELVSAADMALYAAKGGGRGQFRFYSSDLKEEANLSRQIEEDLRDALARDEIELHYQPLVNAKSHEVECFEALIRWNHSQRGPVSPELFIPIAEETKLIFDIGEWALERACRDAMEWPKNVKVAVNLSAMQFTTDDLPGLVERALQRSGLEAARLELEITENVFLGDPRDTERIFAELKALGVRLALDDFGTGYSSLGYLRHAPIDKIKIDQSFVRGCTQGGNNSAIISAVVNLATALGMETVAEGVEAADELELVAARGCHLVQGYIFSRPLPQDDVKQRFADGGLKFKPVGPKKSRAKRRTLYRRIAVIHEDHRYSVMLRNLSTTGARIEGLLYVPEGTQVVLDLGGGQLAVATVRYSNEAMQGLEFETALVNDGAGGLCTRHRVSPYALAAAGMPLAALPDKYHPLAAANQGEGASSRPNFVEIQVGG
ncbi:MAG: EAL domain-containing protein [Alteripontixanthobacter sp.]